MKKEEEIFLVINKGGTPGQRSEDGAVPSELASDNATDICEQPRATISTE